MAAFVTRTADVHRSASARDIAVIAPIIFHRANARTSSGAQNIHASPTPCAARLWREGMDNGLPVPHDRLITNNRAILRLMHAP